MMDVRFVTSQAKGSAGGIRCVQNPGGTARCVVGNIASLNRGRFDRVFRIAVGAILLGSAALKSWQYLQSPIPPYGLQRFLCLQPMLTTFETFLGLWLISGASAIIARRVAIGCFGAFACYTFYEALAGKTDCGCFGQVHVNPWFIFILDASLVLMLKFLGKPGAGKAGDSRWAQQKWPVAAAAAIGLAIGVTGAMLHPKVVSATNGLVVADGGKLVILEPHHWIGRHLPVLADIVNQHRNTPIGRRLATGNWVIMFYHASCEECRHTIPIYENLARQNAASGTDTHVAFIRVPPDLTGLGAATGPGTASPQIFHASLALHGTLDNSHQWFATTPAVVELKNGTVLRVATGSRAMNLKWLGTTVTGQGPGIKEQWPEYKDDGVSDGRSS